MVPEIWGVEGKVWGSTRLVFRWNETSAHTIAINRGGYCSQHTHQHKWNRFVVLSGRLLVRTYSTDGKVVDETIIGPGGITDVAPGVLHQFHGLEDTVALEFYWVELKEDDIDRHGTVGGMHEVLG